MINGKRFQKTFSKMADGVKWKDQMINERQLARSGDDQVYTGITVKELCKEYLNTRIGAADGTKKTYESTINTWILPHFGHLKMRELKKMQAVNLIVKMEAENKSNSTINKTLVILKCVVNFAIDNEYLVSNPFRKIKPLKVDQRIFPYWNQEEASNFLTKGESDPYMLMFKFALNTGLRRGELCGLLWENIKINEGSTQLHFNQQLLPGRVRGLVKGGRFRVVPLNLEATAILDFIGRKDERDYIFTMPNGKSVEPNYLTTKFKRLQNQLGFTKHMKLHGTRHSFASLMSAKGVNGQKIQELLGHQDIKVTQRYLHLSQEELAKTVQIVSFD